jgi:hypothetical protein
MKTELKQLFDRTTIDAEVSKRIDEINNHRNALAKQKEEMDEACIFVRDCLQKDLTDAVGFELLQVQTEESLRRIQINFEGHEDYEIIIWLQEGKENYDCIWFFVDLNDDSQHFYSIEELCESEYFRAAVRELYIWAIDQFNQSV